MRIAEALNFIRQAKSLDVNPRYFYAFTVGVPTADFRNALGKDAEYAFGMSSWLPNSNLKDRWFGDATTFAKLFKDKFGYEPDYHAASAAADVETFAVAIEKAVGEICRVVKTGGRIVIIDKNAEQWGRLKTPEWEKWFNRKELERLLARDCRKVSSRLISYWEDVEPDGLFLAWLAEK